MKQSDDSKCTLDEENDPAKLDRGEECSYQDDCHENGVYDNARCRPDHHCGSWVYNGDQVHGCILSKLCGTEGLQNGSDVEFTCPSQDGREAPVKKEDYFTAEQCKW